MTDGERTYASLLDFGVEPALAREASKRYAANVEAAADWCFGAGLDWKPPAVDDLPKYGSHHARVEYHEVVNREHSPRPPSSPRPRTPPALPPRRQEGTPGPSRPVIGSNNPFAPSWNSASASLNPPPPATQADPWEDDEDAELQRAIRMSQGHGETDPDSAVGQDTEMMGRDERERSVRATAPPPSPDPERLRSVDEEGEVMGTLFGPSTREEEGATAVVSYSEGGVQPSKEDEDLNRAIQDSLMTASFHSASALKADQPSHKDREEGAPLVFRSESGESTYAAHLLQALYAVPQFRDAVMRSSSAFGEQELDGLSSLQWMYGEATRETKSWVDVDEEIFKIRQRRVGAQLPPQAPAIDLLGILSETVRTAVTDASAAQPGLRQNGPLWDRPSLLSYSTLHPPLPEGAAHHVKLYRTSAVPYRICPNLAAALWPFEGPMQSIEELGEVLCVFLQWSYGAPRKVWELEQRLVLDRFMKDNLPWAAQIRAQEGMAKASVKRLQDRLDHLTTFQGNNFHDSLAALIKHYEASSSSKGDEIAETTRVEMKAKLEGIFEALQSKAGAVKAALESEEEAAHGSLFDTTEERYNQHAYTLRAVLMHDGALIAGKHLYAYVVDDVGAWWKVEEHECSRVEWDAVVKDQTGLYMDGGPYCLIYARDGPRPSSASDAAPSAASDQSPPEADFMQGRTSDPVTTAQDAEEDIVMAEPEVGGTESEATVSSASAQTEQPKQDLPSIQ